MPQFFTIFVIRLFNMCQCGATWLQGGQPHASCVHRAPDRRPHRLDVLVLRVLAVSAEGGEELRSRLYRQTSRSRLCLGGFCLYTEFTTHERVTTNITRVTASPLSETTACVTVVSDSNVTDIRLLVESSRTITVRPMIVIAKNTFSDGCQCCMVVRLMVLAADRVSGQEIHL